MTMARARHAVVGLLVGSVLAACTSAPAAKVTPTSALTFGGTAYPLPGPTTSAPGSAAAGSSPAASGRAGVTGSEPRSATTSTSAAAVPSTGRVSDSARGAATSAGIARTTGPATANSAATPRPTTAAPDTAGLSAQEIRDRTAIEAVWVKYTDITLAIMKTPAARRRSVLASVAAEPLLGQLMGAIAKFAADGRDNYGYMTHAIYWGPPVGGEKTAVFGDCLDTSHAGSLKVKTGEKLTVGHAHDNAHLTAARDVRGNWRITQVQSLAGVKC